MIPAPVLASRVDSAMRKRDGNEVTSQTTMAWSHLVRSGRVSRQYISSLVQADVLTKSTVTRQENLSTEFPAQARCAADEVNIHSFWKPSRRTDSSAGYFSKTPPASIPFHVTHNGEYSLRTPADPHPCTPRRGPQLLVLTFPQRGYIDPPRDG